ncbi:hypothetical protein EST38_g785 [Candolleomyces aberdarensis]|uniref:protein-histidine N-methyltransferase n=1 Tax=Candolleomyces aberdarensis TaxID=2316362 RepID=A0A4Q2DZ73_9AGAR|nr:hypothetical protein EST38_g785 [Candolleomyces aberdarensis]
MFKFDFDIDDIDEEFSENVADDSQSPKARAEEHPQAPFQEYPIQQFLDALPTLISYSPLSIPIPKTKNTVNLVRRDLFDARFQLISEGALDPFPENDEDPKPKSTAVEPSILTYLDAPSDLLPGVYEGGLKTWECSLDLVEYLESSGSFSSYSGKRVVELGCGTAVPSLYVLQRVLSEPPGNTEETHIHLQDYNASVLELVTFPNVLMIWYLSPASSSYRESSEDAVPMDASSPGELPITDELKKAFLASLKEHNLHIRFFSGSWESFDPSLTGGNYNLLLTSETIYRQESLTALINLLQTGSAHTVNVPLDSLISEKLSLTLTDGAKAKKSEASNYICLVAAKVLYFGVGGGISDFVESVEKHQPGAGTVECVLEKVTGVGRKVLRVQWG